jgi:hypothetical protein
VCLRDIEVPEKVYEQLNEIADEYESIDQNTEYEDALDWLSDNIKEQDALDWEYEIEELEVK